VLEVAVTLVRKALKDQPHLFDLSLPSPAASPARSALTGHGAAVTAPAGGDVVPSIGLGALAAGGLGLGLGLPGSVGVAVAHASVGGGAEEDDEAAAAGDDDGGL